jgi:hopene-associated glycosyltransferase HpnB
MYPLGLLAGTLSLAVWIYLLTARGGFWKVWRLGAPERPLDSVRGPVAVVIPARDEAEFISSTVQSLLEQRSVEPLHIFVVDDHSSDRTAESALRAADDINHAAWVSVISGRELPSGWTGKLWAMRQGIDAAMKLDPMYLLLTDADIRHSPDNVATLAGIAEAGNYDLVSFMVKLQCNSIAERLLIPPFVFFFFLLYPPAWIRDPRRSMAGAAGGCMLIRPEALCTAGGIAAIRNQIIDDCAMAKAVKQSGGRVWLGVSADTSSQRAYGSFAEIEKMIARTAFNQLQHSGPLLAGAIVGLVITYLLPVALILTTNRWLIILGACSWMLMAMAYAPMVRFYGLNLLWALTLPFSAFFYMTSTVHSALKFWAGRGGEWKGRAQDLTSTKHADPPTGEQ